MKRSCLIFLALTILWSKVLSSEDDSIQPKEEPFELSSMVTVLLPGGRSYNKTLTSGLPPKVKEAFEEVLCGGVIVDERLVYVPAISVEGIKPKDLVVAQVSWDFRSNVRDIVFGTSSKSHRKKYALLVLDKETRGLPSLPIIGPFDKLDSLCFVSELWVDAAPNPSGVDRVPRRGEFGDLKPNKCIGNSAFSKPYGDDDDPTNRINGSSSGNGQMQYASPLLCFKEHGRVVVAGYYAWSYPMDDSSDYECFTDGQLVQDLINQYKTSIEPTTQRPPKPDTQGPTKPDTQGPTVPSTQRPPKPDTQGPTKPDTQGPPVPSPVPSVPGFVMRIERTEYILENIIEIA